MTSTAREAPTFLMTPAQHRQWAENARLVNRPDLAKHHEQLARAIEIIAQRQQERTIGNRARARRRQGSRLRPWA
jgi:hypothetical protein